MCRAAMAWDDYIREGLAAVERRDYPAAEQWLKRTLQYCKEHFSQKDERFAMPLSLRGHVYFRMLDFDRAERLLEQSLRLHVAAEPPIDVCLIMDLHVLGQIKLAAGKTAEARKLYVE